MKVSFLMLWVKVSLPSGYPEILTISTVNLTLLRKPIFAEVTVL